MVYRWQLRSYNSLNGRIKILLVEDDLNQAESLSKLISKSANPLTTEILRATSLKEGLRKAHTENPDAILTDLRLSDVKDYHETIACLPDGTAPVRFPHPVIVTTGMDDPDGTIFSECMQAGADNVFHKPFCIKATFNLLSSLLAASARVKAKAMRETENVERR